MPTPPTLDRTHPRGDAAPGMPTSTAQELRRLILVPLLPLLALTAAFVYAGYRESRNEAEDFTRRQSLRLANETAEFLKETEHGLIQVAARQDVARLDSSHCDPGLKDMVVMQSRYVNVNVIDREGRIICGAVMARAVAEINVADRDWFRAVMGGQNFALGSVRRSLIRGRWVSTAAVPIRGPDGRVAGAASASIDLVGWGEAQAPGLLPADSTLAVITRSGTVVMRAQDGEKWVGRDIGSSAVFAAVSRAGEATFTSKGQEGFDRFWSAAPVPGADWIALAGVRADTVLAKPRKQVAVALALILAVLAVGGVLGLRLSRKLGIPLAELAGLSNKLADGDTVARAEVSGTAELNTVARQFNRMLDSLERHREDRRALADHYRTLIDNARDIILLMDASGRIVEANEAAVLAYGYGVDEIREMNIRDLRAAEALTGVDVNWALSARPGGVLFETIHRRKDGSTFPVEVSGRAVDIEGKLYRQGFVRDITERRRAEVERNSAEAKFQALVEQSMVGVFMSNGQTIAYANPRGEAIFGYARGELSGMSMRALCSDEDRHTVLREIGRVMRRETASWRVEFKGLRKGGDTVMISAMGTLAVVDGNQALIGVLQDVTEPLRAAQQVKEYVVRLENAMRGTVEVVSRIVDMRDLSTPGHERRVSEIAAAIAAEMGLDENVQRGLHVAGAVHDIGKITIPVDILAKPGPLSPAELRLVKEHSEQGYRVLAGVEFPWPVAEVARQHHERVDGSGYPRGLQGDAILLEARILAVADVIEAMASSRPYRSALGIDSALEEIERGRGTAYDANVADAGLRLFREKGFRIPD